MWFITKINIQQILKHLGKGIPSPVSALFPTSTVLSQKTTKPNWWASKEKCPWSHLNQSFLQAGFSLIWGSAPLHILIVFPWSATMTPQMFIQARLEKDWLDVGSGMHFLDTISINLTVIYDLWFMEYAFAGFMFFSCIRMSVLSVEFDKQDKKMMFVCFCC